MKRTLDTTINRPKNEKNDGVVMGQDPMTTTNGTSTTIHSQLYIPYYDNNGNIMSYWDVQGNVVAEYTYDAFGNTISQSGPMSDFFRHRFSTKYFDSETGLYYYGYRYYSPVLMRWLTRDPIEESGGVNLYAMCGNNAVEWFDILGEARMLTGSLLAYKGNNRINIQGYNYAREIIRLVNKLNQIYLDRHRVYDAQICDLTTVSIQALKDEIQRNKDNVYIIAHGGLIVNGAAFRYGRYEWSPKDSVQEVVYPAKGKDAIDINLLGVNPQNVFGCYISPRVRRIRYESFLDSKFISSRDDYFMMYKSLYLRLTKYLTTPNRVQCPIKIRIYEGENANEVDLDFSRTSRVLIKHKILNEDKYK